MSIRLMTEAWRSGLQTGPKMVLLALCDNASDEGCCFPSIATLSKKCSMSERSVFVHLSNLEKMGAVTRINRLGKSSYYTINPCRFCTPEESAPLQDLHPTPAESAPITVNEPSVNKKKTPSCPYYDIINLYNEILPELPSARSLTDKRKEAIRKMWVRILNEKRVDGTMRATDPADALEWFKAYFSKVRENDFLMGRNRTDSRFKNWECDIDYLMKDKAFINITEKT